ncbi:MAG: hypothetical protein O9340_07745 [Cyclobacteriaceae bacterium]|jgi:hypothetical protein|nr:hypothetical protein [Cyclobacteriaceae bacterium]
MTLRLVYLLLTTYWLASCAYQPAVCPAYQSAFIHDKDALRKKFSYFENDSTPKVYAANKNKFLIIEPTTYKKKVSSLQTVPRKTVAVQVPDSLKPGYVPEDQAFAMAERNVFDSTAVVRIDTVANADDSVYQITKDREIHLLKYDNQKRSYYVDTLGYNTEQDNYMWYLRHALVLPDARLAALNPEGNKKEEKAKEEKAERKGIKGFFKGLFKKKEKADTVAGFEGTTSATILPGKTKKTKKEKVKKKKETKPKVETPPAKKEEEEDDGF